MLLGNGRNIWNSIKKDFFHMCVCDFSRLSASMFVSVYTVLKQNAKCSAVPCFVLNKTYM